MALINRPMYEHFGARHLGVKGPGALTSLEEGVMGVLPLDVSSDPAYWYIQGIRMFSANVGQGGTAGNYTTVGLSIESASTQVLCRIINIDLSQGAGSGANWQPQVFRCARTAFSSDPGIYAYGTDTRIPEAQHSAGILLNGNHAARPGVRLGVWNTAGNPDALTSNTIPLVVSPEQCIYLTDSVTGTDIYTTFSWIEIPAYKAEL